MKRIATIALSGLLLWFAGTIMPSAFAPAALAARRAAPVSPQTDREYWVATLDRIARPVLRNLADGTLHANMPIEQRGPSHPEYPGYGDRTKYAYLEALGRTVCGIAPWLELPASDDAEGRMREEFRQMTIKGLQNAMNPESPDYIDFAVGYQALVDAAHLAQGLMRAPKRLWGGLDSLTQRRIVDEMIKTRTVRPNVSNWLLFSAMVEAFLYSVGEPYDVVRVDYPVRQTDAWYVGDGAYGDGPPFHWDYYNSFVIQPMMVDVVRRMSHMYPADFVRTVLARSTRYAAVLERFISPEGTIPPIGRSLQYRSAALQTLSQMALLGQLPAELDKGATRGAMTAVFRNFFEAPGTFSAGGWLQIGFAGSQHELGEAYTCTGSLYLCTTGFLALGLPENDEFWTAPPGKWTSQKAWSGEKFPQDHSIK